MPLIKNGAFVRDPFTFVPDGHAFPEDGGIFVTLGRFQGERENLLAHHQQIGVRLASDENPSVLGDDVHRLAAIAIDFPTFKDGRGFSWARLLRTRMKYQGEVRGVGHFLYDQLAFMARVGFDAFEVARDFRVEDFARAMDEISYAYQPSADGKKTVHELRQL